MLKSNITLVIGGCRSGKSSYALEQADRLASGTSESPKIFIATSVPRDLEMEKRVEKHQKERGKEWQTIESPIKIYEAIDQYSGKAGVMLVDCLTLWVSNLLFHFSESHDAEHTASLQEKVDQQVAQLKNTLVSCKTPLFLVSNEVGAGIVPENAIARQFRDIAGFVNQEIAKVADRVVMTVAGIDVQIKP